MPSKKIGRPVSLNPKNIVIRVKVDESLHKKLLTCCDKLQTTRSEVMRNGIKRIYGEL